MNIVQPIALQRRNVLSVMALRKARARSGVLPFVGAGLSKQCGYPLWAEFLEDCARRAHVGISKYLTIGQYEEAAEHLLKAKGRTWFDVQIRRAFGRAAHCAAGVAASFLPRMSRGPVVTTNFDRVLEAVFRDAGDPFLYEVWGGRPRLSERTLVEDAHVLVKIHGDAQHRDSRVLTRSDYDLNYGLSGRRATPLTAALLRLLSNRPILFLGCRVEDDRYLRLVRRVKLPRGGSHFAVLPRRSSRSWMRRRAKYLRTLRIRPLWYDDGRHEAVAEFLEWLTAKRTRRGSRLDGSAAIATVRDLNARLSACATPDERIDLFRKHEELFWTGGLPRDYLRVAKPILREAERRGRFCDALDIANHLAAMVLGDPARLRRALRKAATLLRRCKHPGKREDYEYNLAISLERSNRSEARRIHARLAKSTRAALAVASLRQLAFLHKMDGRQVAALRLLKRATRRSGRIWEQRARCYTQLGMLLDDMADLHGATDAYAHAFSDYRRLESHDGMASALDNLGTIALQRCRWGEADRLFERAFRHAQIAGTDGDVLVIRRNQTQARYQRAKRRLDRGWSISDVRQDLEEADEHLAEAMVRHPRGGDYAAALTERALLTALLRSVPAALKELNKAARLHRARRDRQWLWTTEYNRGVILLDDDRPRKARVALKRALALAKSLGPSWEARTTALLHKCDGLPK